jgi:hypothetical protein
MKVFTICYYLHIWHMDYYALQERKTNAKDRANAYF